MRMYDTCMEICGYVWNAAGNQWKTMNYVWIFVNMYGMLMKVDEHVYKPVWKLANVYDMLLKFSANVWHVCALVNLYEMLSKVIEHVWNMYDVLWICMKWNENIWKCLNCV